ncbi:MAG: HD domain-containing protein [Bacteroidales bacterium]
MQLSNNNKINKIFSIISEEAEKIGVEAYVIGGFVRDYYLQRSNSDIDIVVSGHGIDLACAVAKTLETKVNVFKAFGTAMIKYLGVELEFVGARKESYRADSRNPIVEDGTLEEDRERRDFTINTMSFSLQKNNFGELIDPFGGIKDLNKGLLRTPLDPDKTYIDDPLRMIRAVRFASQLGFQIIHESLDSIKKNSYRLEILKMERVHVELEKILMSPKPSIGFILMEEIGMLEYILPELHDLKGVETVEGMGHKDNFFHSIKVLDNVASVSDDNIWLRWAALLHDIGKAPTKKFEEGIGWTFHAHDFVGAKMLTEVFSRLKMSQTKDLKYVQKLVRLHMRPIALVTDEVTDSAVRRLLFDAGDQVDDLMILCEADITSKNDRKVARLKQNFIAVRQKLIDVEERDKIRNFQPPVDGELIMKTYGLKPGIEIGIIKDLIKEAILNGEIPNELPAAYDLMKSVAAKMNLKEI